MTINVAVVTSEAIVFGCDSIASTTKPLLDPFQFSPKRLENGKLSVEFEVDDIKPQVDGAWGNVTKMFPLHEQGACVAAVTCGLARLNDRTMSSLAAEFMKEQHSRQDRNIDVKAIAEDFYKFILKQYRKNYEGSQVPEEFWDGLEFLVGGYGQNDQMPSLYRVNIQKQRVECECPTGEYGIAWAGQSDAVVRLIMGYDISLAQKISEDVKKKIDAIYSKTSEATKQVVQEVLDKLGTEMPDGVKMDFPTKKDIDLDWNAGVLGFPVRNWPLQDAVDFVGFLVNIQSARAKFVSGVATVGGRTHVGIIDKIDGFRKLNEPELKHRNIGFQDDL